MSGLDDFEPPDALSAFLGILVTIVHHSNQHVKQDDCREKDVEREHDAEQSHLVVHLLPRVLKIRTDTERRDKHVVASFTRSCVFRHLILQSKHVQRERKPDDGTEEHQVEAQNNVLHDNLVQNDQEDIELLSYATEQDEVRHPAEQENHRQRFEVESSITRMCMSVEPDENRDTERHEREAVGSSQQHLGRPDRYVQSLQHLQS